MNITTLTRAGFVFLVLIITLVTNIEDNFMARLGLADNYAFIALLALLFTALAATRHILIVSTILVLSLLSNMPVEFGLNFGFDRDYYAGFMLALIFQPVLVRALD